MTNNVNHPGHYNKGSMEVIKGLRMLTPEQYKGFLKGNVIKYVARCEYKNSPIEDLEKAEFYLGKLKETIRDENKVNLENANAD